MASNTGEKVRETATMVAGVVLAYVAGLLVDSPSFRWIDSIMPGTRYDDMLLMGFVPYVLACPLALFVVYRASRAEWGPAACVLASAFSGAILWVGSNVLLVRMLTL
jgi:hypothetical protein